MEALLLLAGLFGLGYLATQKKSETTPVPEKPMIPIPKPTAADAGCSADVWNKLDPETKKLVAAQIVLAGNDKTKIRAVATAIAPVNPELADCINKYADSLGTT